MRIEFTSAGRALVARLHGNRLDASVSESVTRALSDKAADGENSLIVNCSQVSFVDASGVRALVSVLRNLPNTASLYLCEVQPQVLQLFRLARMDRVLNMRPTEPEAIEAVHARA